MNKSIKISNKENKNFKNGKKVSSLNNKFRLIEFK